MALTEKIQVLIDVVSDKATTGLSNLKTKVSEAEGSFGKLKAGASGAGNALSALPLPAVAAGAVGVGTALKGLADGFTKAALDAKKMSDATGLNVTASSEWIAAADDVGLSAETVSGAFGKATKALGLAPAKFEELGVAVVHAKDGTVDMNATLLNAIDTIQGTEDPTKKAALASQLFGKSWADLTPLLDKGGAALRETMAATSDAQRITDSEVESAKKWQATMDDLGDVSTNLKMALGKLIVEGLGPTVEVTAELANNLSDLIDTADGLMGPLGGVGEKLAFWVKNLSPLGLSLHAVEIAIDGVSRAADALEGPFKAAAAVIGDVAGAVDGALDSISSFMGGIGGAGVEIQKYSGFITDTTNDLGKHKEASDAAAAAGAMMGTSLRAAGVESENLKNITQGTTETEKAYTDAVNDSNNKLEAQRLALNAAKSALEAKQNAALGALGAELNLNGAVDSLSQSLQGQAVDSDAVRQKLLDAAGAASDLAGKQAEAQGHVFSTSDTIRAQVGELEALRGKFPQLSGVIDEYIGKLNAIPTQIRTNVVTAYTETGQQRGGTLGVSQMAATGGFHSGLTVVGEDGQELAKLPGGKLSMLGVDGQELVDLPAGSFIYTANQTKAMMGDGINGAATAGAGASKPGVPGWTLSPPGSKPGVPGWTLLPPGSTPAYPTRVPFHKNPPPAPAPVAAPAPQGRPMGPEPAAPAPGPFMAPEYSAMDTAGFTDAQWQALAMQSTLDAERQYEEWAAANPDKVVAPMRYGATQPADMRPDLMPQTPPSGVNNWGVDHGLLTGPAPTGPGDGSNQWGVDPALLTGPPVVHIHMENATFIGPAKADIGRWIEESLAVQSRANGGLRLQLR